MRTVKQRLERLEAPVRAVEQKSAVEMTDLELAEVIAASTPYTAREVLAMNDDELALLIQRLQEQRR